MKITSILAMSLCLGLVSCSKKSEESQAKSTAGGSVSSLQSILLDAKPSDAISVSQLRKQAKVGDSVVFNAKVMGADLVLIDERAMMTVGDPTVLTTCDLRPGDNCPTPWDVCCDDSDDIKNSIVSVRAVDSDGGLLKEGFRGLGGIKELSSVVVAGTVSEKSESGDNMIVNTTGIYVVE